ncbi:TPA: hypothetical protein MJC95_27655, partial [Klebsiella pneumoniae]|nr:hypothetical protein [Klebsiella pneumoniae]
NSLSVICHRFEGGSSHLIWKVEGDLSQFCCSLPCILRLLIVFLAVTGSGARIEGNLSPYPEGSLSQLNECSLSH